MVTQVDNSLLKTPAPGGNTLEIQYNNAGVIAGNPFLTVDLTGGSGQAPALVLDGTSGSYRRPTLRINYDGADEGGIEWEEEGSPRGHIKYHASIAGDTDVLRIVNAVNGGVDTNSTIHILADNTVQLRITELGCDFRSGTRMIERASASWGDTTNYGQWYVNSTTGNFTFRSGDGVETDLVPVTATTTELADITDAINTDAAKVLGYMVKNITTGVHVFASGAADGSVWHFYDETTAHTPV